jgi:hypothetical protein
LYAFSWYACGYNSNYHRWTLTFVYYYISSQLSQSSVLWSQYQTNIWLTVILVAYQSPCNSGNGTCHVFLQILLWLQLVIRTRDFT